MNSEPVLRHVLDGLESVLRCFGAARDHVTVVGGLAPSLLVPNPVGAAHVGTVDVDLCLTVALADGATGYYSEVVQELRRAGFVQRREPHKRFRWHRDQLAVDFLYPAGTPAEAMRKQRTGEEWETAALRSLGEDFAALAVGFRRLIDRTRERVEFTASVDGGVVPRAWVYVAGPAGLAALKASALKSRTKHKDAYDLVWVLNERGPEKSALDALARVASDPTATDELRDAVALLDDVFAPGRTGPVWYANFMKPADEPARERHERFALETVAAFTTTVREGLRCEST